MTAKLVSLIDKFDTMEVVRDKIAEILLVESTQQRVLAAVGLKDPRLWALRVFLERSNPWAEYIDSPEQLDATPIVNVWFDNESFDMKAGNVVESQKAVCVINVDCYGYGISEDDGADGHIPGDERAALDAQRAVRLVRNIVMSAPYVYLGLARGTVWRRWVQTITAFQPQNGSEAVQNVSGVRLALQVEFSEFAPQIDGVPLASIALTTRRSATGEIYFSATYGD